MPALPSQHAGRKQRPFSFRGDCYLPPPPGERVFAGCSLDQPTRSAWAVDSFRHTKLLAYLKLLRFAELNSAQG
jgi:hypothetical protein